jgi:hypothetical protein
MLSLAWVVVGALSTLLLACLDFTPVPYDAGPIPDAAAIDAVASDASVAECRQCLVTGACAADYTACTANMACVTFAECMTAAFCWSTSISGDLSHLSPCLLQCATMAGFRSYADPGAIVAIPLVECAQNLIQCGSVCAPSGDM